MLLSGKDKYVNGIQHLFLYRKIQRAINCNLLDVGYNSKRNNNKGVMYEKGHRLYYRTQTSWF